MDYVRVGEKVISIEKIHNKINDILELRCKGYSQQEVAKILDIDRTFISRLESMGEVRKGGDIAVVGFPIKNKEELEEKLKKAGVDFVLLMSEDERMDFVKRQSGQDLFNGIIELISEVRKYKHCIIIGSNKRIKVMADLLDGHVYTIDIGQSPIKEDVYVCPEKILEIVNMING
ncbi:hypothetical protein SAMN05443428_1457 [Caloramator quimbayensis]|uniref:HTH cro/C1-type domain-containing protein n=1 Tax=Caloramator quimbayensis TaxID=1147123 RepID=A0A1T4YH24_9CLOT|nr:helix-turn-helix transcriptional regulator [Caloramator quimbayensis]SKB00591.1 hypothetical protein SAMN05443428_1457 [Caloramator quimbayensis]